MLAGNLARCRLLNRYLAGESGGSSMSTMFSLCSVMYRSFVSPTLSMIGWNISIIEICVNCTGCSFNFLVHRFNLFGKVSHVCSYRNNTEKPVLRFQTFRIERSPIYSKIRHSKRSRENLVGPNLSRSQKPDIMLCCDCMRNRFVTVSKLWEALLGQHVYLDAEGSLEMTWTAVTKGMQSFFIRSCAL